MIRVAHLITGLETGGAQTSLLRLLRGLERKEFDSMVISLKPEESLSRRFIQAGVTVHHLGFRKDPISVCRGLILLYQILRDYDPHVIHGWMYHADLLSTVAGKFPVQKAAVIWGIRHSLENIRCEKISTSSIIRIGAILSRKVDRIVYNAYSSAAQHRRVGYSDSRCVVIPNGFDCERFRPSQEARQWLRREVLGLSDNQPLIGMAARFHPMKAHNVFLKAAGQVAKRRDDVRFLLVGPGLETTNVRVRSLTRENGLEGKVYLLGERSDIEKIYPGLDLLCSSSSFGESFPNVVGEAMACGVPCVVTDVGDSAQLVGNCGIVVPPGDPGALAEALLKMIHYSPDTRMEIGLRARKRAELFSVEKMVRRFISLYKAVATEKLASW